MTSLKKFSINIKIFESYAIKYANQGLFIGRSNQARRFFVGKSHENLLETVKKFTANPIKHGKKF